MYPLAFSVSSRSSECFCRINMRGFLSSPLVVVGKGLKLIVLLSRKEWPLMLDHPEKTARLIAALKVAAPFEITLTPEAVR